MSRVPLCNSVVNESNIADATCVEARARVPVCDSVVNESSIADR